MTHYADIDSIEVEGGRQRKLFSEQALQDLQDSIQRIGLLHAIVVEEVGGRLKLRAGERRLIAIKQLIEFGGTFSYNGQPVLAGQIPYTCWTELTELQRLEIEVEENNQREAFTWQERAHATAQLARLRIMQAEDEDKPLPTTSSLAQEVRGSSLGSAHTATRNDLILSKHLHKPEIAKAKTQKEAILVLKRMEQEKQNARLAQIVGNRLNSEGLQCINADAEEWVEEQDAGQFDVICTDPPYGIGMDKAGSGEDGTITAHDYEDSAETLNAILDWFPEASFRLAKEQAHLYLFCDLDWFHTWRERLTDAGWRVFRTPLIWVRPTGFRLPWVEEGPQRKYETILYAVKGRKKVNLIAPDVITVQSRGEGLNHPAAKPAEIFHELLRRSVRPGDKVLDLFAGTGPVFAAAKALKCEAVGVELSPKHYATAVAQIEKLKGEG